MFAGEELQIIVLTVHTPTREQNVADLTIQPTY
jgi:hypothetical protein